MSLTAVQMQARDGKLTASRVGVLMSGDPEKILHLWEEMTGQRNPDNLSHIWAVQLGVHTEALNLDWYERVHCRPIKRRGQVVVCPQADWAACTLDAFDAELVGPVEAKHCGGFEPRERVIERYQPQLHWQMLCTVSQKAALSIIEGAREPVIEHVTFDPVYADELWWRAEAFMACVENLTPPVALPEVKAPIKPETWRTVSMEGSNTWASFASEWLANKDAAKAFDSAAKELKALVESDVALASGYGVQAKRSKAGALTISAAK